MFSIWLLKNLLIGFYSQFRKINKVTTKERESICTSQQVSFRAHGRVREEEKEEGGTGNTEGLASFTAKSYTILLRKTCKHIENYPLKLSELINSAKLQIQGQYTKNQLYVYSFAMNNLKIKLKKVPFTIASKRMKYLGRN